MKFLKLTAFLLFFFSLLNAQNNYVHQIIVLNEGRFDYTQNIQVVPVTIGTIDPATFVYSPFDTIVNARFASNVVINDQYIYAAADSFLIQYDKNTLQLTSSVIVPGIRKIALWNNQVLVSKGEYLKSFNSYFEVYNENNLNFIYALDSSIGPKYSSEDIIVSNNTAYLAIGNGFEWGNEKDIIGKIDLSSQSYLNEISLGTNATNPENMMFLNNKIYTLNNQDYSTASISEYDITTGTVTNTDLYTPTGCGASALVKNNIYYQISGDSKLQRFSASTLNTFDTLTVDRNLYGIIYDDLNQNIYAGHTDFTSFGKVYKMSETGILLDSVDVSLSPGNIALDLRIGTGLFDNEKTFNVFSYPNPALDYITIELHKNVSNDIQLNVYDTSGKKINIEFSVEQNKVILNTNNLSPSHYIVQIKDNENKFTSNFIKY